MTDEHREGRFFPFSEHRTIEVDFRDDAEDQRRTVGHYRSYRRIRGTSGPLWPIVTISFMVIVFTAWNGSAPFPVWIPIAVFAACAAAIAVHTVLTRRWLPLLRRANERIGVPVPGFVFDDLVLAKGIMLGISDQYAYAESPPARSALRLNRNEFRRLNQTLFEQLELTREAWTEDSQHWHEQARRLHAITADVVEFGDRLSAQL
ncbi:hypothetical protein [Amycolatopsis sp. NPDC051903]|uniref:hypothetical protein n=1 Tax=Amycolatopsis sp. NPDC051903 TaxID=3363936 RepID=UPI00379C0B37